MSSFERFPTKKKKSTLFENKKAVKRVQSHLKFKYLQVATKEGVCECIDQHSCERNVLKT